MEATHKGSRAYLPWVWEPMQEHLPDLYRSLNIYSQSSPCMETAMHEQDFIDRNQFRESPSIIPTLKTSEKDGMIDSVKGSRQVEKMSVGVTVYSLQLSNQLVLLQQRFKLPIHINMETGRSIYDVFNWHWILLYKHLVPQDICRYCDACSPAWEH